MKREELQALSQAFGILRDFPVTSVNIIVRDEDGRIADWLETIGGVVCIDGYTRCNRGCVTLSARRGGAG